MQRIRDWKVHSASVVAVIAIMTLALITNGNASTRQVELIQTPRGIKAWLVEERSIPLISLKFSFEGGSMQDPPEKGGLASLLASLLTEGAGDLTAEAFARRLSDEGAQIGISSSRDQIHGGLDTLSKRFEASVDLLRLAVTAPRFEAESVERARQQRIAELDLSDKEPRAISLDAWYGATFPGQPYGRPANGTQSSVKSLQQSDLRAFHKRILARDNLRVVIVGDIDKVTASKVIDRIFGDLPEKAERDRKLKPEPARIAAPLIVTRDLPLATAAFGAAGLASDHPQFPALQVLNHIIGSGDFDSILMEEIRVKRGLAYAAAVSLINDTVTASILGGMATKSENMTEALSVLKDVLRRVRETGPTPEQVDNAKLYLTGSDVLDFDTNTKLAGSLLRHWLSGKTIDQLSTRNDAIRAVSVDDVRRIAGAVLDWDRFNLVVVGPASPAK